MVHLQITSWAEYRGCARVKYDLIAIHPEKRKFFLEQDAKWWEERLKHYRGIDDEVAHAPIIVVSKEALQSARRRSQASNNSQNPPALFFQEGQMVCLDGQSRIRAARRSLLGPGTNGLGVVHIVLDSIDEAKRSEILYGSYQQIAPNCGRLYEKIRNLESYEGRREKRRLKSMLGPGQRRGLTLIENCERLGDALAKVRTALPTIAQGFHPGKAKTYHATLCEISIEKYLVAYICAFWEEVASQSQSRMSDTGQFPLSEVPSEVFEKLQGLMPQVSEHDRAKVHKVFARPAVFGSLSREQRDALKDSVLETYCMIPSMGLFSVHMRFLEKVSICMKELLGIGGSKGKRGQGCVKPLEDVLKGLYTAERNVRDEYQIQTRNGWRPIHAPFEDRQELSCRQLWLFVMRQDDPTSVDQKHLASFAKKLGFYSSLIEEQASEYAFSALPMPSLEGCADYSYVRRKQRLGQKGGRWLESTKQARRSLFFDIAETTGTETAQEVQQLETFSSLVELACIYRALFGHPFLSSRHAKLSHMDEHTSPSLPADAYTRNGFAPPLRLSSDYGQHCTSESGDTSAPINLGGNSPETPSERLKERNDLETDNGRQDGGRGSGNPSAASPTSNGKNFADPETYGNRSAGKPPVVTLRPVERETGRVHLTGSSTPNGFNAIEPATERVRLTEGIASSHRSTAEPQTQTDRCFRSSANLYDRSQFESQTVHSVRSSTSNDRSLAGSGIYEDCLAESCASSSSTPIESGVFYPSIPERSPSSAISRLIQASTDHTTLHLHENRSAEILTSIGHDITEPATQSNDATESSTPKSSYYSPTESEVVYPSASRASFFSPTAGPSQARDNSNALEWLDLAHLRPSPRIRPTVEGLRGSCPPLTGALPSQVMLERESTPISPLDPNTRIEIQTGGGDDGADQKHGLNQLDSVVEDKPPVSLYPVEKMRRSLDSRTEVAASLGEEMFEQDSSRAQPASEYVACVLDQMDQMEGGDQAQLQSEKAQPPGAGLEGTPSQATEQKGPDKNTYHSDPTSVGLRSGCEERSYSSQLGDDQHHYRTERLFSAEPFTNEESDQGDGGRETANPTKPTNEPQDSTSISSASSSAKSDNPAIIKTSRNPIPTRNGVHGQDNRYKISETRNPATSRERDTITEGDWGHNQSSQADGVLKLPETLPALRTSFETTSAVQEQSDQATLNRVSSPKAPPRGSDISPGSHARNSRSVENSAASSTFVKLVNKAVPAPTEQQGTPNVPMTTKHGHAPCSPPTSRQESPRVQGEPTQRPRRASQPELYKGNDGRAGCSKWRPPYVEDEVDMDIAEDGSTMEEPVSHPPVSSTGRVDEPPMKPAVFSTLSQIEETQIQKPLEEGETICADKETCPNGDSTAATQEQLIPNVVSSPQSAPTGSNTSPGNHAQNLQSVGNSPASSRPIRQVNEAVPTSVERPRSHDRPKTTQHRPTPCSPPGSRQESSRVQGEPAQLPKILSRPELYKGSNGRAGCSKWRPPMVEDVTDMDNAEDGSTVEKPISHPPASSAGRDGEAPVKPRALLILPSSVEKPQAQGPPGDNGPTNADKETCPNEDSSAARRNSLPTLSTNESHLDRSDVPEEPSGKRKRPRSDPDSEGEIAFPMSAKRQCIESPVIERLDGDNRIYWPRSLASFEEFYNHLRRSIPPVREEMAFEPAPQQCGGHTEAFATAPNPGPVYTMPIRMRENGSSHGASTSQSIYFQTFSESIQSEQNTDTLPDSALGSVPVDGPSAQDIFENVTAPHDDISVLYPPSSRYESVATAVPTETAHWKPAEDSAGDASTVAASLQREPSVASLHTDALNKIPTGIFTSQAFRDSGKSAHYPPDPLFCDLFQTNAPSAKAEQATAQDRDLNAQQNQTLQVPSFDQPLQGNDDSGNVRLQTSAPRPGSAGPEAPCPTAATSTPPATSPLVSNIPVTLETIETQTTHASVTEPSAAFNSELMASESPQMGGRQGITGPKEINENFHFGQQNQTDRQPIELSGKTRKRHFTSTGVSLETIDSKTSSQGAQKSTEDISKGGETMCDQNGDPIVDSVGDINPHGGDAPMEDAAVEDAPMGDNLQPKREYNDTGPAYEEIPNKRICKGLNSPHGLLLASEYNANDTQQSSISADSTRVSRADALGGVEILAPRSASGFVFIVELDGEEVTFVHRQARAKIKPWHERPFRMRKKSGNFFTESMRIVEIDPNKSGAISMDRFFQSEEVLVFQHSQHNEENVSSLVKKIKDAVRKTKTAARDKWLKQRYYLRDRKRKMI